MSDPCADGYGCGATGVATIRGADRDAETQNRLCAAQSAAMLVTPAVIAAWPGGWRPGPTVGRGIAGVAVREDVQAWRGEDCGC
ncbi:hypothetical protein [Mycobacterium sp. HNNTM2301]|uniref:hypothetical protein n=1 Tax=Mycobacterium hainanense TaxID=3289775 RepID=UPI0035A666FF